jgi:uncharacterized membrane protein YfcA
MDLSLYILTGTVSGFLAGLLGIGGGLIIVPALVYALPHAGYGPQVLMQTAIGSSLAVIVFTALSSIRAHHRAGFVEWTVVRAIAPGVCVGALVGAALASDLPGHILRVIYLVFLLGASTQMLLEWRPAGGREPGRLGFAVAGLVIGALFIAPYVLFSATSGQLADKHDKTRLIRFIKTLEIAIMAAGIVSTYFQLASQKTCMKKSTTSIAFVQDTAIMKAQPTCGWSRQGQKGE